MKSDIRFGRMIERIQTDLGHLTSTVAVAA
jgi:hypothetical protein